MFRKTLDEDLRERFADRDEGRQVVERSRAELAARRRRAEQTGDELDVTNVGRAAQRLSEHCRLAGRLEESLELKDEVTRLWSRLDKKRALFLVRLQRALVLAELGRRDAADEMADLRAELTGEPTLEPFYSAFLDEYDARRVFWDGDRAGARALLEQALAFREEHRKESIVQWTRDALVLLEGDRS